MATIEQHMNRVTPLLNNNPEAGLRYINSLIRAGGDPTKNRVLDTLKTYTADQVSRDPKKRDAGFDFANYVKTIDAIEV